MHVAERTAPNLLFGSFYGTSNIRRDFAGFSASLMVPEVPACEMPKHSHEDASFVVVLRGVYLSSAAGAEDGIGDGCVIYNPPGTTHRDRFRDLEGAQFLGISISKDNLKHAAEAVRLPEQAASFHCGGILLAAERLARHCRQWADGASLIAEALCWELLAHTGRVAEPDASQAPRWLEDARQCIRENCHARMQVSDIAAIAGVHPVYLIRRFRESFGCTPGGYLRMCRAERAASLLVDTERPLAEVALAAGYADQSQMSKAFQSRFEMTPRQYRLTAKRGV